MPGPETLNRSARFPHALTILVVGVILYFAREVLIPVALAVLLTFLLAPLVRRLERHRVPRIVAVGAAVSCVAIGIGAVGWLVQGQVLDLASNLPRYKENIRTKLQSLRPSGDSVFDRAGETLAELGREITNPESPAAPQNTVAGDGSVPIPSEPALPVQAAAPELKKTSEPVAVTVIDGPVPPLTYAKSLLGPFLSRAATAGIVVVFAIFMLIKREDLRNRILWFIGERAMHRSTPAFDDAARRVSSYLMMQTVANAITGLAAGISLFVLGILYPSTHEVFSLPNAATWGLLIGLFRYIPYVGSPLAACMPLALSLATAPDWTQPILIIAIIAAIEITVGNVIEPLLYGAKTGLSPLAILAATVFWAWLWGPVGLLLATPLTVCLAVIGRHVPNLVFLDALLGDEPVLSPPAALYQRLLAGDQDEAERIIDAFAKDHEVVEVYDELLLPTMRLAEVDRHRGVLTAENERSIDEMVSLIIEDSWLQPAGEVQASTRQVFCIPARDLSDEIAAQMLASLLRGAGVQATALSSDVLTSEVVEQIAASNTAVVCISSIPPRGALHNRVLYKRLRARFPELPIVVGIWDTDVDPQRVRQSLRANGLEFVVTALHQAVDQIRTLAGTMAPAPSPEIVVPAQGGKLPLPA